MLPHPVPLARFHSTDFPSEWGPATPTPSGANPRLGVSIQLISPASGDKKNRGRLAMGNADGSFHSTDFPSEWGLSAAWSQCTAPPASRFHSTDFPSEWGLVSCDGQEWETLEDVSIQLISPASGDVAAV